MRRAVIFTAAEHPDAGALEIAGRPLLMRQLQWLRDSGITAVVIEVAGSVQPWLSTWLCGADPLLVDCLVLPTSRPIGAHALGVRAGIPEDEPVLELPGNVLAQGELAQPLVPGRYTLFAPTGLDAPPIVLRVAARCAEPPPERLHDGWAMRIDSPRAAHTLSCAALTGVAAGVLIHGAEVKPGVWLGRGARVAEDARLLAPVLIGPGARVLARAEVGPRVTLGRGAIVERDAQLSDCSVAAQTLVGEAARARGAHLCEARIINLSSGLETAVDDPLVLTRVAGSARVSMASRALALLLIAPLLVPWLLVALLLSPWRRPVRNVLLHGVALHEGALGVPLLDSYPALFDVAAGRRSLVGPTDVSLLQSLSPELSLPAGAIDILTSLAPSASLETRVRMLRWYAVRKARSLDFSLFIQRLLRTH